MFEFQQKNIRSSLLRIDSCEKTSIRDGVRTVDLFAATAIEHLVLHRMLMLQQSPDVLVLLLL